MIYLPMKTYLYNTDRVVVQDLAALAIEPSDPRISIDEHDPAAYAAWERSRELVRARAALKTQRDHNKILAQTERSLGIWNTPFVWYDHRYDAHTLSEMPTAYIFFALRMVWNHTVPGWLRVGKDLRYYSDVPHWRPRYRRHALEEFAREFVKRAPYEDSIREEFFQIVQRTELILRLGL